MLNTYILIALKAKCIFTSVKSEIVHAIVIICLILYQNMTYLPNNCNFFGKDLNTTFCKYEPRQDEMLNQTALRLFLHYHKNYK